MRGAYLVCGNGVGGSRGGVGSGHGDDYELEVGQSQNASPRMLALCVLVDEVEEFLRLSKSPLSAMILHQWDVETCRLEKTLADSQSYKDNAERTS